jgi:hypothetical protein
MLITAAVLVALAGAQASPAPVHDKGFWKAIVEAKFVPPAGTTARQLAPELVAALDSPDPELRDDLAETILTDWIYRSRRLDAADLRPLTAALIANLRTGIGDEESDGVLRRSFSALTLSVIAARDNEDRVLDDAQFRTLLDAALAYFRDERDVRGFDEHKGWMHSAAHTSDLLKFLARNPRFTATDQARVLEAIAAKLATAPVTFFTGEDERIARVPISIVRRDDFDRAAFDRWLAAMARQAAFPREPSRASLRAMNNTRHVLSALWTELSVDTRPSAGADYARQQLRQALGQLF